MRTLRWFLTAVAALALVTGSAIAGSATPIPQGTLDLPVSSGSLSFADLVGGGYTVLDKYQIAVSNAQGLQTTLYVDAIKTAVGNVDIAYQIANGITGAPASTDTITSLSVGNYNGVAGIAAAGLGDTSAPAGTNFVAATGAAIGGGLLATRPSNGSPITFTFTDPLAVGATSPIILIQTNSTSWDTGGGVQTSATRSLLGNTNFLNIPEVGPGSGSVSGAAVPEPSSLVLGGLALVMAAGAYGRRVLRRG